MAKLQPSSEALFFAQVVFRQAVAQAVQTPSGQSKDKAGPVEATLKEVSEAKTLLEARFLAKHQVTKLRSS